MPENVARLFAVSVGCGALLALLLLLTPALSRRFSPRVRYWAWLLITLRLALPLELPLLHAPVQVEAPTQLTAPEYDPSMSKDLERALPYGYQEAGAGSRRHALWYHDDQNNEFHIYDTPIFRLEGVNGSWSLSIHWEGLWAAGALASLLWFGAGYVRLCRGTKKRRLPASREARQALEAQMSALGITRTVGLWQIPGLCSPMLMGFFRPAILLPEHLPAEALPVTLAHELTHLKRRDLWYKGFLTAVCCIHWFNPLVWLMLRQAGRDVELCCDYDLLRGQDENARRAYGQAILDQMTAADRAVSPLTTGFSGDKRSVFARFRAIMDTTAKKKGTALVVLAMLATVLAGGLVACNPAQPEEGGVSADEPLEFEDVIGAYNSTPDYPHDLTASVVQYGDRPWYQFENTQAGVTVRARPDPAEPEDWVAGITYGSRSSTFQMGHFFPLASWKYGHVAGESDFYLRDLTGDGIPELLHLWGYHQSGMGLDECKIIELTQMKELSVETPPGAMTEAITVRPVDVCKRQNDPNPDLGYVVYEVTGPDGTKHLCQTIAKRKPLEEYSSELDFSGNISLHLEDDKLFLSAYFVPSDPSMLPGISYLGQLTCQLTYDPKGSALRIQPPFTMELFDPVEVS